MDLKNVMLSEISQTEKVKSHVFSLMQDITLKVTNEQTRKTKKHSQSQTTFWWLPEGIGHRGVVKGKGSQIYSDEIFDFGKWAHNAMYI